MSKGSASTRTDPEARRRRRVDLLVGILVGIVLGLAVVSAFVFLSSEGSIDAPRTSTPKAEGSGSGGSHRQPAPPRPDAQRRAARQ